MTETGASTDVAGNADKQSDYCDTDTHTETQADGQSVGMHTDDGSGTQELCHISFHYFNLIILVH